jgi:hypothetical protein
VFGIKQASDVILGDILVDLVEKFFLSSCIMILLCDAKFLKTQTIVSIMTAVCMDE